MFSKKINANRFKLLLLMSLAILSCKKENTLIEEKKVAPNGYDGGSLIKLSAQTKTSSISQYHLYLPEDYKKNNNLYPIIIFLHGGGAKGENIAEVTANGTLPGYALKTQGFPFVVISPQLSSNFPEWDLQDLDKFYQGVIDEYRADKRKIYISGYSIGGIATWRFTSAHPNYFAAAAPVACYGDLNTVCNMKNIPVWGFHNRFDFSYTLSAGEQTIDAYNACAVDKAKFTIYDDTGHEGWTKAYNNPELYTWLASKLK